MGYIHTTTYYLALKSNEILTRYNMDEPSRYYTEWNKPDTKRQILYDSTYTRYIKQTNS